MYDLLGKMVRSYSDLKIFSQVNWAQAHAGAELVCPLRRGAIAAAPAGLDQDVAGQGDCDVADVVSVHSEKQHITKAHLGLCYVVALPIDEGPPVVVIPLRRLIAWRINSENCVEVLGKAAAIVAPEKSRRPVTSPDVRFSDLGQGPVE